MIELLKFSKNEFGFFIFYGESFIRLLVFISLATFSMFLLGVWATIIIVISSIILIKFEDDYLDEIIIKSIRDNHDRKVEILKSKAVYEIFSYTYGVDDKTNQEIIAQWNFLLSNLSSPITILVYKHKFIPDTFLKDNKIYNDLFQNVKTVIEHYFLCINENDAPQLEALLEKVSISFVRLNAEEVKILESR